MIRFLMGVVTGGAMLLSISAFPIERENSAAGLQGGRSSSRAKSVDELYNRRSIITRGKRGMPSFGKKLTRAEINLLVNRVRRFSS